MSTVEDLIKEELQAKISLSADYRNKIQTAKTEYKRVYYTKKLRANNQVVASLLEGLERVINNKKKEQSDEPVSESEQGPTAE